MMRKTLILLLVVLLGQAIGQAQTFEAAPARPRRISTRRWLS